MVWGQFGKTLISKALIMGFMGFTRWDTNMLVSQRKILASGVIAQRQRPTTEFCVAVEYRLKSGYL